MKISEMDEDIVYFLCPDKKCKLFWDTSHHIVPCQHDCPNQDKLIKLIICHGCQGLIELSGNHHRFYRVDHICPNGNHASNFQRMSSEYHLLYKKPK